MASKAAPALIRRTVGAADVPRYRSGAVARMLQMPVATLRVWERRYALTRPVLTPSGQRLYGAADVQRLGLLKQLTDRGHAIGALAALDVRQLREVAATHAQSLHVVAAAGPAAVTAPPAPWRLAVIGAALGPRLQRPALLRAIGRPVVLLGPFLDVAQAAKATRGKAVDALLVHAPQLHDGWLKSLAAAAPVLAKKPRAVLYGFAADAVCEALAGAGTALLREPQPDVVLAQWLRALSAATAEPSATSQVAHPVQPRRWDDAALAGLAGRSSTVACECPRHVAELLVQLAHFEAYSAACEQRSPADAQLHAHLRRVATASRVDFESALDHVAMHEGLVLGPMPASRAVPTRGARR